MKDDVVVVVAAAVAERSVRRCLDELKADNRFVKRTRSFEIGDIDADIAQLPISNHPNLTSSSDATLSRIVGGPTPQRLATWRSRCGHLAILRSFQCEAAARFNVMEGDSPNRAR